MEKEIALSGTIKNQNLLIHSGILQDFCRQNNGSKVVVRITTISKEPSKMQLAYFRKVVVPQFRQGMYESGTRYTEKDMENRLLELCPAAIEEKLIDGKRTQRTKQLEELTSKELSDIIENLKEIAATNLNTIIL